MSWSKEVALILLNFLHDPEIIQYLLSIAKPIHFKFITEEAKSFHESLRLSRLDRWTKTQVISKQRKFNKMNSQVPITCTLPFDNGMWKQSCELLKSIRYMRYGFLRRKFPIKDDYAEDIELEIPLKIKCINLIRDDRRGLKFRRYYGIKTIKEALDDLEIYQEVDMFEEETPYNELPYLLIEIWSNGVCQSGYSNHIYSFQDDTELFLQEIIN